MHRRENEIDLHIGKVKLAIVYFLNKGSSRGRLATYKLRLRIEDKGEGRTEACLSCGGV